ncbi:MAG: glycosyltransferase family 4 protein [Syntrophobacterales bacterium]|jgi:glycosyltransferase involved in cell wall biosynthesis|nr:glycosyltransferase family 4 protein [Syntrophobacterales bacterium]
MPGKHPRKSFAILHTEASLGWGGQERRILVEALAMQRRGHRLALACDPRGELYRRGRQQGFPVTPIRFGGRQNLTAWLKLRRLLADGAVDLLNTHSSLDSWVGALAWRSLRARPLLVRTRHLSTKVKVNWPTRWLYQTPAAIITTGRVTRELLMQRLGVPARRIFSIPTGVDLSEFVPQEKSRELLLQLKIPADAFIFGSVAVLRSWKGHLYLLEAMHQLIETGVRAFLLLVGEGPYRVVIEEKIAQLGLQPWVRLAGYRDQVAPWFALMDVVVLASYANEGVPQSLLQAQAMARPVIGTMVGGIPEVVMEGDTGLVAPPRDAAALAGAMGRLMADANFRRELGQRGRQLVIERFSLEQMAAELEAVYQVLGGRGGEEEL